MFVRSCLFLIASLFSFHASAVSIDWEIANRYRLFKDEGQFRALVDTYASLPESDKASQPALALEIALEKKAAAGQLGPAFGDKVAVARYGWASAVVNQDKNCFMAGDKSYYKCRLANGEPYLEPKKFDALAGLVDGAAFQGQSCIWSVNGAKVAEGACGEKVRLPNLLYGQAFSIAVAAGGSTIATLENQTGRVVTIVGLGDSFASGEGNPDKPALFGNYLNLFNNSSHIEGANAYRLYPLRSGVHFGFGNAPVDFGSPSSAAKWQMAQCHRSLYSQQVKASLQLAIEQPHLAVNFLGYACTGAAIEEGLLDFWAARDDVPKKYEDSAPQLMKLLRDLCVDQAGYNYYSDRDGFDWRKNLKPCAASRRRVAKIDAVLLSIGGNDVNFAGVIANESVDSGGRFDPLRASLFGLWKEAADPIGFDEALSKARSDFPHLFGELAAALKARIASGQEELTVIQTAYPNLTKVGDGEREVCRPDRATDGMQVHEILGLRKATTGEQAAVFVNRLNGVLGDAVAGRLGEGHWRLVTDHVQKFSGHAICQGEDAADPLQFPTWDMKKKKWLYFPVQQWTAYAPRKRWFVTPNDAFLTGNYMKSGISPVDIAQPLFAATMSGAFHPNALGHAAIADSVLPQLRDVVKP
ncbi:hypothetical protein [uncultured Rhodoblastus sp.]|uniref:hypothetical protein n=1 Tax=uncultured Rhodoblastus sp. TaxID=543037 RepID=UPI0025EC0F13|nr:hypothetical protein [uncultured Rhodoblastus sp.]